MSILSRIAGREATVVEALAVLSNIVYLYLYIQGSRWCWPAALVGSLLFVWLCIRASIFAEAALQVFYVGMAVYGFASTTQGMNTTAWSIDHHIWLIVVSAVLTLALGAFLKYNTRAALPWLDSFTTVFSLAATWAMVNVVHENYLYWMVIDAASAWLYWSRGMKLGAALFVVYFGMVTLGYFRLM